MTALLLVLAVSASAQLQLPPAPRPTPIPVPVQRTEPPTRDELVKALFEPLIKEKKAIGLVVGIVDAESSRAWGFGETSIESKRVPDADHLFEIGSVTKVFTGLLLADAIERGKVGLDDPLENFLPNQRVPRFHGKKITLRHLSTHTSGLPRIPDDLNPSDPADPYADYTLDKVYSFLGRYELTRAPGLKAEYSNLGVGLLGHALERALGADYESLVKALVKKLGMVSTSIGVAPDRKGDVVPGYFEGKATPDFRFASLEGCGALRSSARDLMFYVSDSLAAPQGTRGTAIERTQKDQLGIVKAKVGGREVYGHDGSTYGHTSLLLYDKEAKLGVVLLVNSGLAEDAKLAAIKLLRELQK